MAKIYQYSNQIDGLVSDYRWQFAYFSFSKVNGVANLPLSSLKQALAEVKCSCLASFGLLYPHLLLDTKGVLATLGEGDSTKVQGTDLLYCKQIYSEFRDVFEQLGTPCQVV